MRSVFKPHSFTAENLPVADAGSAANIDAIDAEKPISIVSSRAATTEVILEGSYVMENKDLVNWDMLWSVNSAADLFLRIEMMLTNFLALVQLGFELPTPKYAELWTILSTTPTEITTIRIQLLLT